MSSSFDTRDPQKAKKINKRRSDKATSFFVFLGFLAAAIVSAMIYQSIGRKLPGLIMLFFFIVLVGSIGAGGVYVHELLFNASPFCDKVFEATCRDDGYLYYTADSKIQGAGNTCYDDDRVMCPY